MNRPCFASDNAAGIHPEVLAAIGRANTGAAIAYGADEWTQSATARLREAFGEHAEVLFAFNGTGANVFAIAALADSFNSVVCAETAHLWQDECAAPEHFFGGKIIPVRHVAGKIDAATLAEQLGPTRGVHHTQPKVVSITQPTELGAVYRPEEIRALADLAHANGLLLHVDGARLANAAVALETSLAGASSDAGADVISFGGTKNGLLGGEAVVFVDPALATRAAYMRKQATQLAAKMRFIAVQFEALLTDDLWRRNAAHANAMATRLAAAVANVDGIDMVYPVEINALFPRLPADRVAAIQACGEFYMWDHEKSVARWMTSFATTAAEVDQFAAEVTRACSATR